MQVHQSRVILSVPIVILSGCFLMLAGLCASVRGCRRLRSPPLDPVLGLVVVHRLLSLGQEGVHALVCAQEPVHAHDGLEGQDAVWRREALRLVRHGALCMVLGQERSASSGLTFS